MARVCRFTICTAISPRLIIRLSDLAGGFVTLIPAKTPKAHFGIPPYLPDRPDRLAPCRGHAPDVTLRRP
jgi:hypothetical protein